MKRFALLILSVLLCIGCTTNYYLVSSPDELDVYQSTNSASEFTTIPSGHSFITKGKSNQRFVQYGNFQGYAKLTKIRKQTKLTQADLSNLEFNPKTGYVSKPYFSRDRTSTGYSSSSPRSTVTPKKSTGGTVHVKGYTRKDGTYVRPHTRSAPRKR